MFWYTITMVFRHDVKLYATLVEYASVFSLWSLVVSYHKGAKPWNLECIFHAHWKNGSAEQLIPFLFKCAGMLVHCFLLFNTWHHWILDSTLRANDLLATDWGLSDHTYNLLHHNHKQWPRSIIKLPFFSINFWCNLRGPVTSNKFQMAQNSCLHSVYHSAIQVQPAWQDMISCIWLLHCRISYWLKQTVQNMILAEIECNTVYSMSLLLAVTPSRGNRMVASDSLA